MSLPFEDAREISCPEEEFTGAKRYLLTVDGEDFSFLHWDGAGPLVLFVHALGFSGGTYAPLARKIQEYGYNVLAIDLRGHGRTTAPWVIGTHTWSSFAVDLSAILQLLPGQVNLMGHSLGGLSSLRTAKEFKEKIASLTLLDPTMIDPRYRRPYDLLKLFGLWQKIPIVVRTQHRTDKFPDREAIFKHYRPKKVFASFSDDFLQSYVVTATRELADGSITLCCDKYVEAELFATTPYYIYNELKTFTPPPTILFYGEHSDIVHQASAKKFKRYWPQAKVAMVPSGCHFFPMSHTDYVVWSWNKFIQNIGK